MRVVIDLQGAQSASRFRGVGRYALALSQAVAKARGDHEVIVVLSALFPETIEPIRAAFQEILPADNVLVWHAVGPVAGLDQKNVWRKGVAECIREAFIASLSPDILLITSLFDGAADNTATSVGRSPFSVPTAVIVYDLIPLVQSDVYFDANSGYEKFYREKIEYLKQSDIFLAISEFSRRELLENLPVNPARSFDISAGVSGKFRKKDISPAQQRAIRQKFKITRRMVMYSGATDERKNHLRLIKAYSTLPQSLRDECQLVIVGGLPQTHKEKFQDYADGCGLGSDEFIVTGVVTDDEMVDLYNIAELFVFPSWHEGFGLPAVEAMICGVPTIGANNTSLPEIIGRDDALFDPFDELDIAGKMQEFLESPATLAEFSRDAQRRAKEFTWDNVAKRVWASFNALHDSLAISKNELADCRAWVINHIASIDGKPESEQELLAVASAISRTFSLRETKQFLVDVSELAQHDAKTGVQRVVRGILKELLDNPPEGYEITPVYCVPGTKGYRYANRFTAKFLGKEYTGYEECHVEFFQGDIFLGLDLQPSVVTDNRDFYQELRDAGVKVYFEIYDLLPVLKPTMFGEGAAGIYFEWFSVLSKADGVVCISRTVADEYLTWLSKHGTARSRPLQVGWAHIGADIKQSRPSGGLPDKAQEILEAISKRPTFLMVGTMEPRKGHAQTLHAFEQLWHEGVDVNLVIVGKRGWNVDLLIDILRVHSEKGRRLFWLEGVSDEFLEQIYASSSALIAASDGEGFGLPLIEAALHELPIIARDLPVFKEVAGRYATYFSGKKPEAIAETVKEWLNAKFEGRAVGSVGMPYITWKQSAERLLQIIVGGDWYANWLPNPDLIRYDGNDPRLHSHVGRRDGLDIHTTGRKGHLLFGSYMRLAPGRYTIAVHGVLGSGGSGGAHMDVSGARGTQRFAYGSISGDRPDGELVSVTFDLNEACDDAEVRVYVNEKSDLLVSMIEIRKAAKQPEAIIRA